MLDTSLEIKKLIEKYPDLWKKRRLKKREFLYEKNKKITEIFFCEKGIIRVYSPIEVIEKEVTNGFFYEKELVIPIISYVKNTPIMVNFETLEECIMQVIKIEDWKELEKKEPIINDILLNSSIDILLNLFKFQYNNSSLNIQTRFYNLLQNYPPLKKVNQEYLADFFGYNPATISRKKNKKAEKINEKKK